jgi:hypothetical protein
MLMSYFREDNEPLGAEAPPLVGGGGPHMGGVVGIPRAHDRYIVNTSFTLHYHEIKNGSSRIGNVRIQRSSNIYVL